MHDWPWCYGLLPGMPIWGWREFSHSGLSHVLPSRRHRSVPKARWKLQPELRAQWLQSTRCWPFAPDLLPVHTCFVAASRDSPQKESICLGLAWVMNNTKSVQSYVDLLEKLLLWPFMGMKCFSPNSKPRSASNTCPRGGVLGTRDLGRDWFWAVLGAVIPDTAPSTAASLWWHKLSHFSWWCPSYASCNISGDAGCAERGSCCLRTKPKQSNSDPSQVWPISVWVFVCEQNGPGSASSLKMVLRFWPPITHLTIGNDNKDPRVNLNPVVCISLWSTGWP